MKQILKQLRHTFLIVLITLGVILVFLVVPSLKPFFIAATHYFVYREGTWQSTLWKHTFTPSNDIVLISIDDASINALQAGNNMKMLSIPKSIYTSLIEKLEGVGVRAIGFDIVFQNADSEEIAFRDALLKYPNTVIATTLVRECSILSSEALVKSGSGVASSSHDSRLLGTGVLGYTGITHTLSGETGAIGEPRGSGGDTGTSDMSSVVASITGESISEEDTDFTSCAGIPRSLYRDVTWGFADLASFSDRRYGKFDVTGTIFQELKKEITLDTFPLAIYKKLSLIHPVQDTSSIFSSFADSLLSLSVGHWGNDTNVGTGLVLSPFFGPPGTYTMIPLAHVLSMNRADLIRNFGKKIVILGEHGTLIHDSVTSPVTGTQMAGMESHAHFLDGLIQSKIPHELSFMKLFIVLLILTCGSVILFRSVPGRFALPIGILSIIVLIFLSRVFYSSFGLVVNIFPILLAGGLLSYPVTFIYEYFIVNREKRFIEGAFSHYIDPEVVRSITSEGSALTLSGEKRDLTVFFSDIENFTTLSEKLPPRDLFDIMSSYLSVMTDILIREKGTLDKYIGDGIMGFFGAPGILPDHPLRAVRTAVLMQERLPSFNREHAFMNIPPINFRVGIATGEVIVGNIGSRDRFNYTVLGDTVNLASRLEAIGKVYHTSITVTEEVYFATRESFHFRRLDRLTVKGKTKPVTIYECIGFKNEQNLVMDPKYTEYERCLELYFAGQYLEAGKAFEHNGLIDPTSHMMAERCLAILEGKAKLTDGVWEMHTK